jgi:hypothetical protein
MKAKNRNVVKEWLAQERAEMAELYRGVRKDNPRIARLLYARVMAANKIFKQSLVDKGIVS